MPTREEVFDAIRSSWSVDTCGTPELWSPENPALGQCDVSSFAAWDYLGGDLVLAKVFIDGEHTEHHYWNRINGEDHDLTGEQYRGNEEIREFSVVTDEYLRSNQATMKPDVAARLGVMRAAVEARLTEGAT